MNLVEYASALTMGFNIVRRTPPGDSLADEEEVFMRAFTKAYKDLDVDKDLQLKYAEGMTPAQALEKFLRDAFAEEKARFATSKDSTSDIFYAAVSKVSGRAIGYISVDKSESSIYLAQLAVDPACEKSGIGRALVFCAADEQTERIHLLTRRVNARTVAFYKHLGFKETERRESGHEHLDPKLYIAMEWLKKDQDETVKSPVGKLL